MSFKRFAQDELVISSDSVTQPVWSTNDPTLTTFVTSSTQTGSNTGLYYYDIYNGDPTASGSYVQFSVAYCDKVGSGSAFYNVLVTGSSPSRTNYGQYRTMILGDENADFVFGAFTSSYFYAINIDRARYKESLLEGSLTLKLSGSGAGAELRLTDNSNYVSTVTYTDAGRVYQLISGSAGTITASPKESNGYSTASGSYGLFLPDVGIILLNGAALDGAVADGGIALGTGRNFDTNDNNQNKLFLAMSRSAEFRLNNKETISSNYVFVNVKSNEFNYSENPSYVSGSTGEVLFNDFINNPISYITTVGLYNDANELLAVAKLSRPLKKDFIEGAFIRVKLDY